jgi:glyoxylase-like metal-dependent hydrolase (beta-lactamase superfamily II)
MSISFISNSGRFTAAFLLTAALAACEGADGEAGPQGPVGPPGAPGAPGEPGGLDPSLTTADKAFTGLGGEAAITGLTSFSITSEGTRLMLGEGFDPEGGSETVSAFTSTTTYDLANDAFRIDWDRDFFFFVASLAYSEVVNKDLAYVKGTDSIFVPTPDPEALAAMPSDRMAAIRKEQRLLNPLLIMLDVAADASIASDGGPALLDGVVHERLVVSDAVSDITLYVNPNTGLITKLETWENDHLRRDVLLEAFYADWQVAGDVQFPGAVFLALDGELLHAETRTIAANAEVGDVAIPAGLDPAPMFVEADADRGMHSHQFLQQFTSLGIPNPGVQSFVLAVPLDNADPAQARLFHLTGGGHHSLAIKQENGVVIAEAPLYPERSQAILAWVETQFPGTPVTHVIATHHHFDHTGGLREFVAVGAEIVVHAEARVFFEGIFRAPSTVVPDTLSMSPVQPKITSVSDDDVFELLDNNATVRAFPMSSSHAKDMLLIYADIAGSETVFVSDIFSPGFPSLGNGPAEVLAAILDFELTVAKIAGGHGLGTATLAELQAIVNPPPAN